MERREERRRERGEKWGKGMVRREDGGGGRGRERERESGKERRAKKKEGGRA